MKGEYISIKTLRELKKQRDNIQTSALQLDKIVKEKQEEIERLNNIINELEKELYDSKKICIAHENLVAIRFIDIVLNKLQELKGSDKE